MVGGSDLPFRLLVMRHGATAAYTQMYAAADIVDGAQPQVAAEALVHRRRDGGPLIVQLAGDVPEVMAAAARVLERGGADAVDINLGCPQERARRGHYGAYLTDKRDWPLVARIVAAMVSAVRIPVFVKVRLQDTVAATVDFVARLVAAGAALVAVHGRQRGSDRHRRAGPASLPAIAAVAAAIPVPVLANGNVACHADVHANLAATAAAGIMAAEGVLRHPGILGCTPTCSAVVPPPPHAPADAHDEHYLPVLPPAARLRYAGEYLDLVEEVGASGYTPPPAVIRAHVGWLLGRHGHGTCERVTGVTHLVIQGGAGWGLYSRRMAGEHGGGEGSDNETHLLDTPAVHIHVRTHPRCHTRTHMHARRLWGVKQRGAWSLGREHITSSRELHRGTTQHGGGNGGREVRAARRARAAPAPRPRGTARHASPPCHPVAAGGARWEGMRVRA